VRACPAGSWTIVDDRIAVARAALPGRAARWVTTEVGRLGRSVNEVAVELGCDWHTVNDAVVAYGEALLAADVDRVGAVDALGLDETLFFRKGPRHLKQWCTSVVDAEGPDRAAKLIEIVEGRTAAKVSDGLDDQPEDWRAGIRWGVLDMSGPLRQGLQRQPGPRHPGRRSVPRHQARQLEAGRVPATGAERDPRPPGPQGRPALPRPPTADQGPRPPRRRRRDQAPVAARGRRPAWRGAHDLARERDRPLPLRHRRPGPRRRVPHELIGDMLDSEMPEVCSLGRALNRWRDHIVAWHHARVTNGPTEAINNLIKRIKRIGFGLRRFRHYRVRALLYAGKPNWHLLATVTPR
jgi:hypothetical protein